MMRTCSMYSTQFWPGRTAITPISNPIAQLRVFGMKEIMVYLREPVEFDHYLTMKNLSWALIRK